MKIAIRIAQTIVILALLFAAAGFLLPSKQSVTRQIVIDAPIGKIMPHLTSARAFHAWSPWAEMEPDLEIGWSGPEQGVGSGITWDSARSGTGSWVVTAIDEGRRVDIALEFGGSNKAASWFELALVPGGTQVTWGFETEAGMNPIHRWFGLMLDDWVGGDYEKGLRRLREKVEGRADLPA